MKKMTELQARKAVEDQDLDWEDRAEMLRKCPVCGMWVYVDDYSGDKDKCDAC